MSQHAQDIPSSALDEAIAWRFRLREEDNAPQTLEEFEAWLALNNDNKEAWARLERMGRVARAVVIQPDSPACTEAANDRISRPVIRHTGRVVWTLVACFILAPVIGVATHLNLPWLIILAQADASAAVGEKRDIALEDGSRVVLGAQSAIKIQYSDQNRKIVLLAGEAYFDVRHDTRRPFEVESRDLRVRDIGTRFDIMQSSTRTAVAVAQGEVAISSPLAGNEEHRLHAGQGGNFDLATHTFNWTTVDPENVGSWQSGIFATQHIPMQDLVEMLRRYYPGYVWPRYHGQELSDVGGVYDLQQPVVAFQGLTKTTGGSVKKLPHQILYLDFAGK
ncbi:FecR family protein [Acetobacter orientalis]|uniref:FecR family protein n=1 Tax=Acetobacter orientalis TaxID=146474 RepID=UPI0039E730DC